MSTCKAEEDPQQTEQGGGPAIARPDPEQSPGVAGPHGQAQEILVLGNHHAFIHDVDDPDGRNYGSYLTRRKPLPDPAKRKARWI